MLDLVDELQRLVSVLDEHKVEYALCGGMALGVHGLARTTIDIDFLISPESLAKVLTIAQSLGYNIRGMDMSFAQGSVEIRRISKIDPADGDLLSLDLLLVTPAVQQAWDTRMQTEWEGGKLSVVSTDGLIALKRLRNSEQDLLDIKALVDEGYEEEN